MTSTEFRWHKCVAARSSPSGAEMKLPETFAKLRSQTRLSNGWIIVILAVFAWVLVWALVNGVWAILHLLPAAG